MLKCSGIPITRTGAMELRQLRAFLAVAQTKHLGRAANAMHRSQPPLTRQIKSLESELGVLLFTRTPRGMVLTPAGEALLHDARALVDLTQEAEQRARRAGRGETGLLDVGLYGSATFGAVPRLLRKFQSSHPDVRVNLHYAQMPQQVAELRQGRIKIAFERLVPNEPDLHVELVIRESLMVAMSVNHPLAKRRSLPLLALRDVTIRMAAMPHVLAHIVELCRRRGFQPRFKGQSEDAIMATLLAGLSDEVALVPQSIANWKLPFVTYVRLDARDTDATMDLYCFHRRNDRSPLLAAMMNVVKQFRVERGEQR